MFGWQRAASCPILTERWSWFSTDMVYWQKQKQTNKKNLKPKTKNKKQKQNKNTLLSSS